MNRPRLPFALLTWLVMVCPAVGGLYDPARPEPELASDGQLRALPFDVFRGRMSDLIAIAVPMPEARVRKEALAERDALKSASAPADLIRRGIVKLRLRDIDGAMTDLQLAYARNPRDYWAVTALGTAYLATGQPAEAARYLEAAHDLTPADWPARAVAAPAEATLLRLARLRLREQVQRPGRRIPEEVDDLFGLKFVDAEGKYVTGRPAEGVTIPPDAIAQVQQLLLWMPDDARLYWQLGELYNAAGDLDAALAVFSECLDSRRFDSRTLRERRQDILAAIAARPAPEEPQWKPSESRLLLAAAVTVPVALGLAWLQIRQWRRRPLRRQPPGR
jgi:tetratricopeptide (TPR) repeat protein